MLKKFTNRIILKLLNNAKQGKYGSIQIACFYSDNQRFYTLVVEALNFIKAIDPKRYRRLTHEIDWIVNTRRLEISSADYIRGLKMCSINFELHEIYSIDEIIYFSMTLIHETTHGYLY